MSSKNAKPTLLQGFSIKTRLTVFYSIAAFILLTIITLFLYWETINILYKADYQFLSDEVESLQQILNNKKLNLTAIKKIVVDYPGAQRESIYRYYTRILDNNNKVMIETPGMSSVFPLDTQSPSIHLTKKNYRWYKNRDANYLVIQAPVRIGTNKDGSIQIILDISFQHTLFNDRKFLILALFMSGLCSLLLGLFIAHRGMLSLYHLTDTVKNITAKSLHQRIDPSSLPNELKTLGLAFNQMLDRIESSFVRLKQFSSDLAHELRIPINNLIGQTEICLSRAHNIDEYQAVLTSNLEEFQRISQLIENILFLSRAENPQLEITKSLLNVDDEIAVICDYYQAMADEKSITVTHEGKASLHINSIMFRRMISNILSNALKYTPDGGWIKFVTSFDGSNVKITVSDSGIGIPPEHLPKIFDRFYRVDSARSQQSGGIGLGLSIVKSIVDLHHGKIAITSIPDQGTRVIFTFPATDQQVTH